MIAAALDLVDAGFAVFPVGPDGRSPLVKRGCYAATRDPAQIEAWWRERPAANVAIACGPASGLLALDVDRHGGADGFAALAELVAEFGPLPPTVTSRTPGGGKHFLFRHPETARPENRVGLKRYGADGSRRVYHGLDVRGAGGSICAPPSRKASGAYTWERDPFTTALADVPGWLLALMLSEPPPREVKPLRIGDNPSRTARYVVKAVEGECEAIASTAAGTGRNQRLFIGAARLGELVGAGLLQQDAAEAALERAAEACGLTKEDGRRSVRLTIASGLKRGIANPREVAA